ncbi:MAG: hypothetical protein M1118_03265 [Chloroflexi bacterium]|nr:hypothetical protein [Chloroflexota bacterium]
MSAAGQQHRSAGWLPSSGATTATEGTSDGFFFDGVESPNGTIFPDILIDRVMPHLSGAEFKVLAYVVRRTFGFKKDSDTISLDQICNGITRRDGTVLDEGTGLARKTAVAAIHGLESKGVIVCQRRSSPERGNLPTSFALRFKGQPASDPLGTNSHPGSGETYLGRVQKGNEAGSAASPGGATECYPQRTVLQPTALQHHDRPSPSTRRGGTPEKATPDSSTQPVQPMSLQDLWSRAQERLAQHLGAVSFEAWLAPARLQDLRDGRATVVVASAFAQRWVQRHLLGLISEAIGAVAGFPVEVTVIAADEGHQAASRAGATPRHSQRAQRLRRG